ncbi:MAG: SMP-30/gluconolactonase/LRE family protein [Planctomycetes bacterium]|nr:SMP-30/gluconolactonase/LRE family protein [Planctomycetota bacterium]
MRIAAVLCAVWLTAYACAAAEEPLTLADLQAALGADHALAAACSEPPRIDGKPWDTVWRSAPAMDLRYTHPDVAGPAKFGGEVRFATDARHLYARFHGRIPKGGLKSDTREADALGVLDDCAVGLWLGAVTEEGQSGFLIAVNSNGVACRRTVADGASKDVWAGPGIAYASGQQYGWWTVEIQIPWTALPDHLQPSATCRLGLHAFRKNRAAPLAGAPEPAWGTQLLGWPVDAKRIRHPLRPVLGVLLHPHGPAFDAERERIQRLARALPAHPLAAAKPPEGFPFSRPQLEELCGGSPARLVPVVPQAPEVDGQPDDEAWRHAEPITLGFLDGELAGTPLRNRTFVRTVSDAEHLYVLFLCEEEKPAQMITQGAMWAQDMCEVLLDVGRTADLASGGYFILEANSKGETALARGDGQAWKPASLRTCARVNDRHWVLEMRIAYRDLGIDSADLPAVWGVNFLRYRTIGRASDDHSEDIVWANTEFAWRGNVADSSHMPDRFGVLGFQSGRTLHEATAAAWERQGVNLAALGLKRRAAPKDARAIPQAAQAAEARFVHAPDVQSTGERATIQFTVQAPVDAAVSILDAQDRVVRHLAAGHLGPKAPKPFQPDSLKQELNWDFKDDYGRRLPAGTYRVHVGLGLKASFGGIVVGDRQRLGRVHGLVVDAKGILYAISESIGGAHYRQHAIIAFDREGRYVRQTLPFPARLPRDQVAGARVLATAEGEWMPLTYQPLLHPFVPQIGSLPPQQPAIAGDGRLMVINGVDEIRMRAPKRLLFLGADGGVSSDYLGPVLADELIRGQAALALSPDGRFAYVTGLEGRTIWGGTPHHAVYRFDLNAAPVGLKDGFAEPWLGTFETPGDGETRFQDPTGLAVDAQGRVYVADQGNGRIAVFEANGAYAGAIRIERPSQVAVHPKTGAVYVLALTGQGQRLVKFDGFAEGKQLAEQALSLARRTPALMALDAHSEAPLLWVSVAPGRVHQLIDQGATFEDRGDTISAHGRRVGDDEQAQALQTFEIGHEERYLHCGGYVYDVRDGSLVNGEKPQHFFRGRDGKLYAFKPKDKLERFTAQGEPDPFPKSDAKGALKTPRCYYFTVDAEGSVFTLASQAEETGSVVRKHLADGTLASENHLALPMPALSSGPAATLACDRDGALYIACSLKQPDELMPKFFEGRLPRDSGVAPGPWLGYAHCYGSVVKFKPTGGRVTLDPAGDWAIGVNYGGHPLCRVEGLEWAHLGISPLVARTRDHLRCTCEHASFGTDGFGRIFVPDAMQFRVEVLDTEGQVLTRFGRYGNRDAEGPGSPAGEPEIGFAWPIRVRVTQRAAFVADKLNGRIVRVDLGYRAEAAANISAP